MFRRYGVARANDPDEMLDVAAALSVCAAARGRGVGVVSASGGSAVWLADALHGAGLDVPLLAPSTQAGVQQQLPSFASIVNPVDITGAAAVGAAQVLLTITEDPAIDIVILSTTIARVERLEEDRESLVTLAENRSIPTLVYSYTDPAPASRVALREMRLPCFTSIAGCAQAAAGLVRAGLPTIGRTPGDTAALDEARSRLIALEHGNDPLSEYEAKHVLRALPALAATFPPKYSQQAPRMP